MTKPKYYWKTTKCGTYVLLYGFPFFETTIRIHRDMCTVGVYQFKTLEDAKTYILSCLLSRDQVIDFDNLPMYISMYIVPPEKQLYGRVCKSLRSGNWKYVDHRKDFDIKFHHELPDETIKKFGLKIINRHLKRLKSWLKSDKTLGLGSYIG